MTLQYVAGHKNKSYTHNYPSDDGKIVADDRSIPAAQAKVA
jgi:hypothetical protein